MSFGTSPRKVGCDAQRTLVKPQWQHNMRADSHGKYVQARVAFNAAYILACVHLHIHIRSFTYAAASRRENRHRFGALRRRD